MIVKFSKRRMLVILSVLFVLAGIFTFFTFRTSDSELSGNIVMYMVISGLVFIILGVIFKSSLPLPLRDFTSKSQRFFRILIIVVREIVPNRVGLLICLVLLILFAGMGQARELLLLLSENKGTPPIFFILLTILALCSWFWTRFAYSENIALLSKGSFFHKSYKDHLYTDNIEVNYVRGALPKIFGFFIILIPTFFILALYLENVKEHDLWVCVSTFLMYFALLIIGYTFVKVGFYFYVKSLVNRKKWLIWLTLIFIIALSIIPAVTNSEVVYSPKKIPYLYLSGGVICVLYFLFASLEIDKNLSRFKLLSISPTLNVVLKGTTFAALTSVVAFILYNIWPIAFSFNGLTVLLAGLIFYTFFAYLMFIIGGRFQLPILTILLIGGAIYSHKKSPDSDLHKIRMVDATMNPSERNTVAEYITEWFEETERKKLISEYSKNSTKGYPIIFVSAEGGGSRAAYWTLLVHDALENSLDNYYSHIFSMSGASGGNTGNSVYLAYRDYIGKEKTQTATIADLVFKNDFVSTDIAMLFGRDAWQSTFAVNFWYDRSEFLQQKWENAFTHATNLDTTITPNPLKRDFLSFWYDQQGKLTLKHPLFLLHTTHVQSGDHATMSAVKLDDFIPQNMDLLQRTYTSTANQGKGIPLSSGALLNSRFPIICPSGKIPEVGNFVDAGYYDNFGAAESRRAMIAMLEHIDNNNLNRKDFNIIHLVIRNGLPYEDKDFDPSTIKDTTDNTYGKSYKSEDYADLYEYTSIRTNLETKKIGAKKEPYRKYKSVHESIVPISALSGAAFAHPNRELAEAEYIANVTYYFDLRRTEIPSNDGYVTPILPLSRHLSSLARKSMIACIGKLTESKEYKLMLQKNFLPPKTKRN